MKNTRVLPKEALSDLPLGSQAPIWWAMVVLIAIETTVFATLISSYFYLRFTAAEWPPQGVPVPDLLLPIVNTVVLFLSTVAVFWGSKGIQKGDVRRLKWGVGIGVVMEVAFFGVKVLMSILAQFSWTDHAYGSIYWTISRLHSLHVVVAILMGAVVWLLAVRGYFTEERRLGVQTVNLYWQFVAVIWIPVFFVLYLVPRWF